MIVAEKYELDIIHSHYVIPHALAAYLAKKIGDVKTTQQLNKAQRLFNIATGNLPNEETVASTITLAARSTATRSSSP